MKFCLTVILALFLGTSVYAQDKSPYVIYDSKGKKVTYKKMMDDLGKRNILMFGEQHNCAIAHWLQVEVTKDLLSKGGLILGAEMMEADNQDELDDYLAGKIDQKGLDSLARLWPNYKTDYAPLIDFAKENQLKFVASNIPRRYARMVYKGGFEALDSLTEEEKSWMAPLPIVFDPELPTYKNILLMMGDHGSLDLVKAQAIKDATMAYFILRNYQDGMRFIHYNGAYHSDQYEGIVWYLKQARPELKYGTISTVTQDDVNKLLEENKGIADYIICVDADMTTTY